MSDVSRGNTTALAARVADRADDPTKVGKTLQQRVRELKSEIEMALPKAVSPDRFLRIVLTEIRETPKLARCTPESFLGAVMQSAQLGLEFGPLGLAYLVPYKDECQLIIGYKGYLDLARRSGNVKQIVARAVHEQDTFRVWTDENGDHLLYERGEGEDRGPIIKYFGLATFTNGGSHVEVMSLSEIQARKQRSAAASSGFSPWKSDPEAMSKKTVIRAMVPWLPLTTEVGQIVAGDEQINILGEGGAVQVRYIDAEATANGREDAYSDEMLQEQVTDALNAVTPNAQRLECSRYVLKRFGGIDAVTADNVDEILAVVNGWPDTKTDLADDTARAEGAVISIPAEVASVLDGLDEAEQAGALDHLENAFGPEWPRMAESELLESLEGYIEAVVAPDAADEASGGDAPTQPSLANLGDPGPSGGTSDEVLDSTKVAVDTWDTETCNRILLQFGLPRTGSLESKRVRLITHLAPLRAAGDAAAADLF